MANLSLESEMHYIQPSYLNARSMYIFNVRINTEYKVQWERQDTVKNAEKPPRKKGIFYHSDAKKEFFPSSFLPLFFFSSDS